MFTEAIIKTLIAIALSIFLICLLLYAIKKSRLRKKWTSIHKIIRFTIVSILLLTCIICMFFLFGVLIYKKPEPLYNPPLLPYYLSGPQKKINTDKGVSFKLVGLYSQGFYPFRRYAVCALINNTDKSIYPIVTTYDSYILHPQYDYAFDDEEPVDIVDYNSCLIQEKMPYDPIWEFREKIPEIKNTVYRVIELKPSCILFIPFFFGLPLLRGNLSFRYYVADDVFISDLSKYFEKYEGQVLLGSFETEEIPIENILIRMDELHNVGLKCFHPDNLPSLGHSIYNLPKSLDLKDLPIVTFPQK